MTFSLTGRCRRTGMFGIAVTTSSIAVASRCPWARAGVGAVATQNVTNPAIGNAILDLLAKGVSAQDALDQVMRGEKFPAYRQVAVIGKAGRPAHYSGAKTLGTHNVEVGEDSIAAGNLLSNKDVPRAMVDTFEAHPNLHIAERLLRGLEEGIVAGGELGPVKSAGLCVVSEHPWPLCDLRVDSAEHPVGALRRIWEEFEPQMNTYITRAINPPAAESYGVPGDP
ncbi:MAG: DUF1028 domain-containing protein [Alphaproteobacteria bacterium]